MSNRWPEPVREPLPVGLLTEDDIDDALRLTVRYMTEPEDPAFDVTAFAALHAARAALIECAEAMSMARVGRELAAERGDLKGGHREWERLGQEYVARKVARRVIDDLRRWLR